ncbi:MAG TPA: hypothetical protein DHW36_04550 [Thalassospira sp.]|nr:hypothetical protein [Thalassospira sp.]|tara:strand:+ start:200 stop:592 length:393 start_codon:yes stop_codon:yes gene_type:complete
MKVLGIEFAGKEMRYILTYQNDDEITWDAIYEKLSLSETRSHEHLRTFNTAVGTLLAEIEPDLIGIKKFQENGSMSSGGAAIKMEAILLLNATCEVKFISSQKIKKFLVDNPPKKYIANALTAAILAGEQ